MYIRSTSCTSVLHLIHPAYCLYTMSSDCTSGPLLVHPVSLSIQSTPCTSGPPYVHRNPKPLSSKKGNINGQTTNLTTSGVTLVQRNRPQVRRIMQSSPIHVQHIACIQKTKLLAGMDGNAKLASPTSNLKPLVTRPQTRLQQVRTVRHSSTIPVRE